MLDNGIKRRINAARDVLVGQIPDPKGQVEQITTALVYKFMDDLDRKSVEAGGKRAFFVGEYARFAWEKLLDKRLSGDERRDLYAQAVEKMAANERLPDIFRAMFKGAFLPFRDPRILTLFLREIDALPYRHSEDLGNPFEHLLSIMGTQGDAGQFRTPRHIIDFIVAVVDPQKGERIHDPACGTAGFLISAFRHIQKANAKNIPGDSLTQSEKRKLPQNLIGLELDPGMARLSLVNMYLHGVKQPNIREYDTLTYDDLWDESYAVILANPPFMTPKGGIHPHSRFAVRANRSEVLFVDYIAERLSPRGRAGIIVPEGIVFQSQRAYKELRRQLLADWGLWAVVSLPAGVFNPYSGVKTSILFLDKLRAKSAGEILFVRATADGFDLGAQRRPIAENDLPQVQKILSAWKRGKKLESSEIALWAAKDKIAEDGEYNLTAERYRPVVDYSRAKWPMVRLGEMCDIQTGKKDVNEGNPSGKYPFFTCAKTHTFSDVFSFDAEALLIAGNGDVGSVKYYKGKFEAYQRTYVLTRFRDVVARFLYFFLSAFLKEFVQKRTLGNTMPYIRVKTLNDFSIPLPPLAVQKEIIAEVDGYQRVIDGARLAIANWKPTINIDPDWPMVKLGDIAEITAGNSAPQGDEFFEETGYPFCRTADVGRIGVSIALSDSDIRDRLNEKGIKGMRLHKRKTILLPKSGASIRLNHRAMLSVDSYISSHLSAIYPISSKAVPEFVFYVLCGIDANDLIGGQDYPSLRLSDISNIDIFLPPLEVQQRIVAELSKEEDAIAACRRLIDSHEQKIHAKIAALWEEK